MRLNETLTASFSGFLHQSSYSLSEYVLGYLYAKERGYRIKDIMTDANVIEAGFNEYQQDLRTRLYDNLQKVSKESFIAAVKRMEMHENFEGIVNTMDESVPKRCTYSEQTSRSDEP